MKRLVKAKRKLTKGLLNDILHNMNIFDTPIGEVTDFYIDDNKNIYINIHETYPEEEDWTIKLPEYDKILYRNLINNYELSDDPTEYTIDELDDSHLKYTIKRLVDEFYPELVDGIKEFARKYDIKFDEYGYIIKK